MNQIYTKFLLLTFAIVLAISILVSWPTTDSNRAEAQIVRTNSTVFTNSNAAPPVPPIVDDFVPEFANLPTYDEMADMDKNSVPSSVKLIDILEFKSPDEMWPSYSKKELPVRSGENWLGLYRTGGELFLANSKVTRSDRKGYIGPGDELYDWLKFERKGELLFLVKDVSELKPGKINTLYSKEASTGGISLEGGYKQSFQLGNKNYVLRVTTGLQRDGERVNVLMLESGGKSQMVTFNRYYKDHNTLYNIIGELIWVGDMDGDGKLDFYFSEYGYEKGGFGSNLFLSSPAKDGRLVENVAGFSSAGC